MFVVTSSRITLKSAYFLINISFNINKMSLIYAYRLLE